MENSFIHRTDALILCLLLFVAMLFMVQLGRIAGKKWKQEESETKGISFLLNAIFGLSAFILAFTFGMSASRYSNVRDLIIEEANNIGTALLRSDLYTDSVQDAFRADFKKYIDARVSFYDHVADADLLNKARLDAENARIELWRRVAQQSKGPNMIIPSNNMIPALNSMFDIATTIEMTLYARVPDLIIYMLFILGLVTSFIGGYTSKDIKQKDWIIIIAFALFSSMVTYITLDLGRPMRGVMKGNIGKQAIIDIRKSLR
ncbi:hypothetical protein A4H97_07320 [Niastella yeongjuensis]|uniref:DUF4239 domain-containing protein n=1 Tax=Niastella yeongjuensis TaxID=354355 RepID=A0A1V9EN66_9BACT|nr:hypothetical protein [Niastella yeongjuensis]OQP47305.1 hypothetical protein A4H97_07320 [Niastella yeongjuensis]SEN78072.1 hypothetical protein SAMN05660816_01488 [Niastella yeongjuensis]